MRGRTARIFQIAFKQQHRSQAVDRALSLIDGCAGLAQHPLGFGRSQPFVPKHHGQMKVVAKALRKLGGVSALAAFVPAHMEWTADQQRANVPFGSELLQFCQIVADADSPQRFDPLRRQSEFVAQCQSDAFLANVKRENTAARLMVMRVGQLRIVPPCGGRSGNRQPRVYPC